ncbi:hypothetical protein NQ317_007172 [Molorchus minor]|uniref:Protein kinase domain-containing protein n=1 Tax=Molorchus minor TaxID=1323400 RepID=A0ABQ9K107_9CUCU|nr:hypothetical protein NQ317_007172 [Molorchus minor]
MKGQANKYNAVMAMENFNILNILGSSITSTTYKVRHKETNEVFIWQMVDCETLSEHEVELLTEKLNKRKEINHPNLLKFYDYIENKESNALYIVTEYCENGCLRNIIDSCLANNTSMSEELLCRILYQIAFTIKTTDNYVGKLAAKEIFIDKDFNVKLYNFKIDSRNGSFKEPKMSYLGLVLYEACLLKPFVKTSYENEIIKDIYTIKLEKLRKKEAAIQFREQELNEKERKLAIREKKISIMERTIAEKWQQAELYLNRCRESKSASSGSTKSNSESQHEKKSYENLDSTYVSCGDSILLPTSTKLNVNKIVKPASFTRTLSERRIRFKGHSPLKEMDLNKRKSFRQSRSKFGTHSKLSSDWLTCSEDTDKSSREGSTTNISNKSRQLFKKQSLYENDVNNVQCKPIVWTEESKKYAFELLKIMNDGSFYTVVFVYNQLYLKKYKSINDTIGLILVYSVPKS